jgi:ABC-2 type transport system permease protein
VLQLFYAEWIKIVGNRWRAAFLLWIFPVGTLAFVVVIAALLAIAPLFTNADVTGELDVDHINWANQAISAWSVPTSLFGRMLVLALASLIFAGEYQWQTLKMVVPHAQRVKLVVTKFVAIAFAIVLAFTLMSLILVVGAFIFAAVGGGDIGPAITGDALAEFGKDYLQYAGLAFTLAIISANFAALASMLMRSILGGTLVGIFFTYVEGLLVAGLVLLAHLFDRPKLVYLYRLTPSYNVDNVRSWITDNRPATDNEILQQLSDMFDFADDAYFSMVILLIWVIGLVGLTAYLFHKQDLT